MHNISNDERPRLAVGLIDLAFEHEKSISNPAADKFYGSVKKYKHIFHTGQYYAGLARNTG